MQAYAWLMLHAVRRRWRQYPKSGGTDILRGLIEDGLRLFEDLSASSEAVIQWPAVFVSSSGKAEEQARLSVQRSQAMTQKASPRLPSPASVVFRYVEIQDTLWIIMVYGTLIRRIHISSFEHFEFCHSWLLRCLHRKNIKQQRISKRHFRCFFLVSHQPQVLGLLGVKMPRSHAQVQPPSFVPHEHLHQADNYIPARSCNIFCQFMFLIKTKTHYPLSHLWFVCQSMVLGELSRGLSKGTNEATEDTEAWRHQDVL